MDRVAYLLECYRQTLERPLQGGWRREVSGGGVSGREVSGWGKLWRYRMSVEGGSMG